MRTEWSLFVKKKTIWIPTNKDCFDPTLPRGSGKKDLLIPLIGFRYFVIIWPWKSAGYFIWKKKLNPLDPRMLLLSLVEIG